MTFDIALENHVADPKDIESGNISAGAPCSSHTNQELATFGAPTSSHGSEANDPKLPTIERALAIVEILKLYKNKLSFGSLRVVIPLPKPFFV
jgi:hypothetical protein